MDFLILLHCSVNFNIYLKLRSIFISDGLKNLGLTAVGPYDILSEKCKKFTNKKNKNFLLHWRFYFDPPEFQVSSCWLLLLIHFNICEYYFRA